MVLDTGALVNGAGNVPFKDAMTDTERFAAVTELGGGVGTMSSGKPLPTVPGERRRGMVVVVKLTDSATTVIVV